MMNRNQAMKRSKKLDKKVEKKIKKKEKKERRKKSVGWRIFKLLLMLVLLAILVFAGIFTYKVIKNGGGLQGILATSLGHDEFTLKDIDEIRVLVIGVSGFEKDYKLADTIMLCSYNPKNQQASILSIPRDTYVGKNKEKASASYKINSVYRNGENIDGMVKSIENIVGLEINNYLVIDTEVLVELVDAIGGVYYDVPIDMWYDDDSQNLHIHLNAGYQKLTGKQAEGLVRFRHNNDGSSYPIEYGDNDLGRMKTQREFITQVLKQTLKPENILKINDIVKIAMNNVNTNLTFETIKDYIPYSVNFNTENLKTNTLPGTPELANNVYIYTVNKAKTKTVVEELFENKKLVDDENNTVSTNTTNTTNTTKSTSTKKKSNK